MKSSELSNGENRIAVRQLLQNRKLRLLSPKTPKIQIFYGHPAPRGRTALYNICPSLIEIGSKTAERNSAQTNRQTDRHYENNGHLAVNQLSIAEANLFTTSYQTLRLPASNRLFQNSLARAVAKAPSTSLQVSDRSATSLGPVCDLDSVIEFGFEPVCDQVRAGSSCRRPASSC